MTAPRKNVDGRVARGLRTRQAIIDAHAELLRDGELKPTAQSVARRAGVSVRTLWLNFSDLEELLHESTAYWLDADDALVEPVDPTLPLADRIEQFCAQRARRLENIGPAARAAALGEPFSAALQESRQAHVRRALEDVERTFAVELEGADRERVHAVTVASSWPAWSLLRDDFGLDVPAATSVMSSSIRALLAE